MENQCCAKGPETFNEESVLELIMDLVSKRETWIKVPVTMFYIEVDGIVVARMDCSKRSTIVVPAESRSFSVLDQNGKRRAYSPFEPGLVEFDGFSVGVSGNDQSFLLTLSPI